MRDPERDADHADDHERDRRDLGKVVLSTSNREASRRAAPRSGCEIARESDESEQRHALRAREGEHEL